MATQARAPAPTARHVRADVLKRFWDLASEREEARIDACEGLVRDLSRASDGDGDGGGGADAKDARDSARVSGRDDGNDDGNDGCDDAVAYALRRLTRGLSSGRGGARQGFALALSELARGAAARLTPGQALEALDANVAPITKSTKGSEIRDIFLGRLFGAGAVARALQGGGGGSDEERARCGGDVARRARAVAMEKMHLAEPAAACVIELKSSLGAELFGTVVEREPSIREWLSADCSEKGGAETVWLACELYEALPNSVREKITCVPMTTKKMSGKKTAKTGARGDGVDWSEMFTRTHLKKISNALLEASYTHPRMHSAWEMLIREAPGAGGTIPLWEVTCEEGLFVSGSHQRRFLGFRVFDALLNCAEVNEIPGLFSDNFVKCLLNNLSQPDNYLHECALDCLARIIKFASNKKTSADKKIAVIAALQRQGPTRFDQITKTNAVQDLVKSLDESEVAQYLDSLFEIVTAAPQRDTDIVGTAEELESALANGAGQRRRLWALEQMAGLTSMLSKDKQIQLVQFMMYHAFYRVKSGSKKGKSALPGHLRSSTLEEPAGAVRAACATRALAMLNANIRALRASSNKDASTDGKKSDVPDLLDETTSFCRALESDANIEMCDAIPSEYAEVRSDLFNALDACEKSKSEVSHKVMPLIRVLAVLQVSDWREYTPALQDLPRCINELIAKKQKKKKDDDAPEAIDVLTDILLSLLAQPSALLRDVVEHTFKAVSGQVSKEGIQDMLRIVAGPEVSEGAEGDDDDDNDADDVLMEADDSDMDDDDDEDEDEDDEDDEDDDEDDFGEANEAEIAAMRAAASKVVGTAGDSDSDSDSDGGMDDAAMFRIDKLLGEAFKSRQQDLRLKKNLKRATRDFKFRVISLLELYAKAQPGSPYLPGAVVTLLDATRDALGKQDPQSVQLAQRISSLINKHISHARDLPDSGDDEVTADDLQDKLKSVIVATNRGAGEGQVFNNAAGAAAAYLLRVLEAVAIHEQGGKPPAAGEEVASAQATECFREGLKMFKSKGSKLKSGFFARMFARHPALAAALLPELFGLVSLDTEKSNARAEFLRLDALTKLIIPVIQSSKKRYPKLAKISTKSMKLISSSIAAGIGAPYKNKNTRADFCKQSAVFIESLDRLLGDVAIKSVIDVDAVVNACAKQMSKAPALPPKATKAIGRICSLLGRQVPVVDIEIEDADDHNDDDAGDDSDDELVKKTSAKDKKDKKKSKRKSTDGDAKASKSNKKSKK